MQELFSSVKSFLGNEVEFASSTHCSHVSIWPLKIRLADDSHAIKRIKQHPKTNRDQPGNGLFGRVYRSQCRG